jgi:hypothetical protein
MEAPVGAAARVEQVPRLSEEAQLRFPETFPVVALVALEARLSLLIHLYL